MDRRGTVWIAEDVFALEQPVFWGYWDAEPDAPPALLERMPDTRNVDSYGCGDSFAAGLTVGLARGLPLEGALALGARCGAACLTARGGLAGQLTEP